MTEKNKPEERCERCRGYGYISHADHHPSCDGNCKSACPVEMQEACGDCCGTGREVEVPL